AGTAPAGSGLLDLVPDQQFAGGHRHLSHRRRRCRRGGAALLPPRGFFRLEKTFPPFFFSWPTPPPSPPPPSPPPRCGSPPPPSIPAGQPANQVVDVIDVCQTPSPLGLRQVLVPTVGGGQRRQTLLYVVCFLSGQVMVVDPDLGHVLDTILIGGGPNDIAFST